MVTSHVAHREEGSYRASKARVLLLRRGDVSWSLSKQLSHTVCLNYRATVPQGTGHRARFPVLLRVVTRSSHGPDGCEIAPALPVEGQLAGPKAAEES